MLRDKASPFYNRVLFLQIQSFISSLSPAQLEAKRAEVEAHVAKEAAEQGLGEVEASQLLQETLLYNGLTLTDQAPPSLPASVGEPVPGLPVPGTLEHTVALALFNAQQFVNQALSGPSQPAVETKQGVSSGGNQTDGSVLSAVSSLPASLSNAAVQVLKFVNPASKEKTEPAVAGLRPGQSYSEVVTGVDPTYTALGVLTTGALASVAFSYVASDSDIASSATDLALGAVDAIARNDIVQNIANNDLVERIKNNEIVRKATDVISNNKLLRKASSAIASIKNKLSGNRDGNYDPNKFYNIEDADYGDYGAGLYQTNFDYYQELAYTDRYPYQESESRESDQPQYPDEDGWHLEEPWDDNIEWFEPEKAAVPEKVPHISYSEDHNPWHLMNTGQSTDHLYRAFSN